MQKTISVRASAALALEASVLVTVPAAANGGDFFNELAESWGANVDTGTPFFGFVRDARGKPIPRAIVTATVQRGLDGESVTIISDNLGHYRIPGLGKMRSTMGACSGSTTRTTCSRVPSGPSTGSLRYRRSARR